MTFIIIVCSIVPLDSAVNEENGGIIKDNAMTTEYYESDITVNDDNSYAVKETIDVDFKSPRHGIYRYIPYMGHIDEEVSKNDFKKVPYCSDFKLINSNTKVNSVENENGTKCITFGDEDVKVSGRNQYVFEYEITPKTQKGYTAIYYNIFPTGWRNEIPAGSSFRMVFPGKLSQNEVKLFYGAYGESRDASEILDLDWNGNILTGRLKENLPVGNGITLYAPVDVGYFKSVNRIPEELIPFIIICALLSCTAIYLYIKYGKEERVIESVQFNPPEDYDSAACGYMIDGISDNEDIISLIVYLADKGYLKIKRGNKDEISFIKVKNIDENMPQYIKTVFNGIFGKNKNRQQEVKLSSLKYKFASEMNKSKNEVKSKYNSFVFDKYSKVWRYIFLALSILPIQLFVMYNCIKSYTLIESFMLYEFFIVMYGAGIIILAGRRDIRYCTKKINQVISLLLGAAFYCLGLGGVSYKYLSRVDSGLAYSWKISLITMIVCSIIVSLVSIMLRTRKKESYVILGEIVGFRDFIEKAELDRIRALAEENPQWFYTVLPYAYVFGLSNVWIKKFKDISIAKPDWYYGVDDSFNFYVFNRMLIKDLNNTERIFASVQSSSSSGGSGSSGGGGFSGGGFGGGGGGSW